MGRDDTIRSVDGDADCHGGACPWSQAESRTRAVARRRIKACLTRSDGGNWGGLDNDRRGTEIGFDGLVLAEVSLTDEFALQQLRARIFHDDLARLEHIPAVSDLKSEQRILLNKENRRTVAI